MGPLAAEGKGGAKAAAVEVAALSQVVEEEVEVPSSCTNLDGIATSDGRGESHSFTKWFLATACQILRFLDEPEKKLSKGQRKEEAQTKKERGRGAKACERSQRGLQGLARQSLVSASSHSSPPPVCRLAWTERETGQEAVWLGLARVQ